MGKISCLECETLVEADQLNYHINTEHLGPGPFRCLKCLFCCPTFELLESHQIDMGHSDELEEVPMDRWWMSLANVITANQDFSTATKDLVKSHREKKGHLGEDNLQVLTDCSELISTASKTAEKVGMEEVLRAIEEKIRSIRSGQLQVNDEIISNPLLVPERTQISPKEVQKVPSGKELRKTPLLPTGENLADQLTIVTPSAKSTAIKSIEKQLASSVSNSAESADLSTELSKVERRRNDSSTIQTAQDEIDTGAVQQSNLTSASTPLHVNSAEKQLESGESEADEMQLGSFAAEVGNFDSDSHAEHKPPSPEIPDDGDMVGLTMSTLSDRFATTSPSELLPDIAELMRSRVENVAVLLSCHRLIDQYPSSQLEQLETHLRRSLTEVLLSIVKFHRHNSLIVEKFCDLLTETIDEMNSLSEVDLYLGAIDFLLEIICDVDNMTTSAIVSTLYVVRAFGAMCEDEKRSNLIGPTFVEKVFGSIRLNLEKSESARAVKLGWDCLVWIFHSSWRNLQRFVNGGGIRLFQQCYEKFNDQTDLLAVMTWVMCRMSEEKSYRRPLMANGNLAVLWEIWNETEDDRISSNCMQIFSRLPTTPSTLWLSERPTIKEVRMKVKEAKKKK